MTKKLPNIFKGKAPKNLNQTTSIINQNKTISEEDLNVTEEKEEKSVNRQIKDVFSSENFVYKADTLITLVNGDTLKKTIIGRTNDSLITIDDELIEVSQIAKIEIV